jgi:hypothetical protein
MRAAYLGSLALLGCVAANLLGWLASIPGLAPICWLFFGVGFVLWFLALIFELPVLRVLKTDQITYRGILFGFGAAILLGVLVRLCAVQVLG